jgi:hypothetical protein
MPTVSSRLPLYSTAVEIAANARWTGVWRGVALQGCADRGHARDDTDVHGYDSELAPISTTVRAQGTRVVFEGPKCGRQPLEAFVRFEYSDDLFDGISASSRGEQKLFTWFNLVARCPRYSHLLPVADLECA